jgi:hypothetical protein
MLNDILGRKSQDAGFLKRNDELETVAKAYKKALLKVASAFDLSYPAYPKRPTPYVVPIIAFDYNNPGYPIYLIIMPIILRNQRKRMV